MKQMHFSHLDPYNGSLKSDKDIYDSLFLKKKGSVPMKKLKNNLESLTTLQN